MTSFYDADAVAILMLMERDSTGCPTDATRVGRAFYLLELIKERASRESGKEGPDSGSNPDARSATQATEQPSVAKTTASVSGPLSDDGLRVLNNYRESLAAWQAIRAGVAGPSRDDFDEKRERNASARKEIESYIASLEARAIK